MGCVSRASAERSYSVLRGSADISFFLVIAVHMRRVAPLSCPSVSSVECRVPFERCPAVWLRVLSQFVRAVRERGSVGLSRGVAALSRPRVVLQCSVFEKIEDFFDSQDFQIHSCSRRAYLQYHPPRRMRTHASTAPPLYKSAARHPSLKVHNAPVSRHAHTQSPRPPPSCPGRPAFSASAARRGSSTRGWRHCSRSSRGCRATPDRTRDGTCCGPSRC